LVGLMDDFSDFATYESELNRFTDEYHQTLLCLYDLGHFAGIGVVDLLRTHRRILLGGLVIDNPHYLSPDEYLTTREERGHGWASRTSTERQVTQLVAQYQSNAEIGARLALSQAVVDRHLHRVFRKLDVNSRADVARHVPKRIARSEKGRVHGWVVMGRQRSHE
jgi:DNA-binding CsgD family transcriptional regulator